MLAGEMRHRVPENKRPYELVDGTPGNVLIIGAGNGMDVAAALEAGADHVDAVEIDPRIYDLGASRNPDQPYADPRVHAIINDGRAVLEQSHESYDMVIFALPDSLSLVSGQSSLRLESYLFTEEAFTSARDHLADDGVFVMYNAYREPWLVDRMAGTLQEVFDSTPCVEKSPNSANFAVLAVAKDQRELSCSAWVPTGAVVKPATDDAPFPYLRDRSIPTFYLAAIALDLGLIATAGARRVRTGPSHDALRRPVLHGRGLLAARDEERRPIRPAVRNDLARQRIGVRRSARRRLPGRRAQSQGRDQTTDPHLRRAPRGSRGGVVASGQPLARGSRPVPRRILVNCWAAAASAPRCARVPSRHRAISRPSRGLRCNKRWRPGIGGSVRKSGRFHRLPAPVPF